MKPKSFLLAAASFATFILPAQASAAEFLFNLSGDASARWVANKNPSPQVLGGEFRIPNISGLVNGNTQVFDFFVFSSNVGGGLALVSPDFQDVDLGGDVIFEGPLSSPTFLTGTFNFFNFQTGGGEYSLTISEVPAIPEPSTWLMMLLGFGLIGGAMRSSTHKQKTSLPYLNF